MQFILIAHDKPGALPLRMSTRPEHLVYLEKLGAQLRLAGPLLDQNGNAAGSVVVIEAQDEAEARRLYGLDPFAVAGLFADTAISAFRTTFSDGRQI